VSNHIPDNLAKEYQETFIDVTLNEKTISEFELFKIWKTDFFIITATNPYSKKLSEAENSARDGRLEKLLQEREFEYLRAVGYSKDKTWQEPGWAVKTSDEAAIVGLAKLFEQNAVFKVSSIGREIVNCLN
jgi:hypothetical protein